MLDGRQREVSSFRRDLRRRPKHRYNHAMAWPTPAYSRNQVNKAGTVLASSNVSAEELAEAFDVLTNWRACHGYPINTFQATLRTRLKLIDDEALVAQRLKRTPSIVNKLRRYPSMRLSQMQDIGGLRAVVASVAKLRRLEESYREGRLPHELVSSKDYIAEPKSDGYRSIHLVYRYKNERASEYDGLLLELQLRTRLQHAWATAVETMGTFLGQALKARQGEKHWLDFFAVTGSAFAHQENLPVVPEYARLSRQQTFKLVAEAERDLQVLQKLRGFTIATNAITTQRTGSYHLVILDSQSKAVQLRGYSKSELAQASADYALAEARAEAGEPIEVVLVAAGRIQLLRRAYPNYFLDTSDFIARVERIIADPGA